jgi:outer membrane protein assembly factor BamB
MKFNRVFFFAPLMALLAFSLSACGTPPATNWPGMSTDGEIVYLADGGHVYNVQVSNGGEVSATIDGKVTPLRFPVEANGKMIFYAPPAITPDGILFVGNAAPSDHFLYSVDAATGNIKWSFETEKPWLAGVLVLGDAVFAPAGDGNLYAFSLSGKKLWEMPLSEHALWTAPATDGTSIYLATIDHDVYCINPVSGDVVWQVELDNGIIGHPAIVNNTLYVGTLSGNLYALNAASGSQIWVKTLDGSIWGTPAVDVEAGVIYIGTVYSTAGKAYALNAETGQVIWTADEEGSIIAGPLVASGQVIFVTETGRVQARNAETGGTIWQHDFPKNKIYTPPLLAGDVVVVAPMGSQFLLAAYDLDGAQKWTFTPAK